jgi:heme-degrading monooxygenase HmoA
MHVQIVTFNLGRISESEYIDIASQLAPRFAALPGLLAKVWLENPDSGTYGAIYLWEDEEAMDRFMATDLFEGSNRGFANLVTEDFSVLENLTRATQPVLTILEDSRAWAKAPAASKASPAEAPAKAPAAKKPKVTKVTAPVGKGAGRPAPTKGPAPGKARSRSRKATS